jgi:hypothetical protein
VRSATERQRPDVGVAEVLEPIDRDLGAGVDFEVDVCLLEGGAKIGESTLNRRRRREIALRNMWRRRNLCDTVSYARACEFDGRGHVGRTVIDSREDVDVQIDHRAAC